MVEVPMPMEDSYDQQRSFVRHGSGQDSTRYLEEDLEVTHLEKSFVCLGGDPEGLYEAWANEMEENQTLLMAEEMDMTRVHKSVCQSSSPKRDTAVALTRLKGLRAESEKGPLVNSEINSFAFLSRFQTSGSGLEEANCSRSSQVEAPASLAGPAFSHGSIAGPSDVSLATQITDTVTHQGQSLQCVSIKTTTMSQHVTIHQTVNDMVSVPLACQTILCRRLLESGYTEICVFKAFLHKKA